MQETNFTDVCVSNILQGTVVTENYGSYNVVISFLMCALLILIPTLPSISVSITTVNKIGFPVIKRSSLRYSLESVVANSEKVVYVT